MIGTATSKLSGFSSAACPPRLKIPTLYPVFPRLRVGIAAIVRGFAGIGPSVVVAPRAGTTPWESNPAATAPPVFRKVRRSAERRGGFMADTSQDNRMRHRDIVALHCPPVSASHLGHTPDADLQRKSPHPPLSCIPCAEIGSPSHTSCRSLISPCWS